MEPVEAMAGKFAQQKVKSSKGGSFIYGFTRYGAQEPGGSSDTKLLNGGNSNVMRKSFWGVRAKATEFYSFKQIGYMILFRGLSKLAKNMAEDLDDTSRPMTRTTATPLKPPFNAIIKVPAIGDDENDLSIPVGTNTTAQSIYDKWITGPNTRASTYNGYMINQLANEFRIVINYEWTDTTNQNNSAQTWLAKLFTEAKVDSKIIDKLKANPGWPETFYVEEPDGVTNDENMAWTQFYGWFVRILANDSSAQTAAIRELTNDYKRELEAIHEVIRKINESNLIDEPITILSKEVLDKYPELAPEILAEKQLLDAKELAYYRLYLRDVVKNKL